MHRKTAAQKRRAQIRITVASLDRLANYIQANAARHGIPRKAAHALCLRMDRVADMLDAAGNDFVDEDWSDDVDYLTSPEQGSMSQEYQDDEPYMETFDAPTGMHEGDADEENYMDWFNNNDFEEVQEHVQEERSATRNASRRRVQANVSDWRYRWAEEGEEMTEEHEGEEMTEEEHEAGMRWARQVAARLKAAQAAQAAQARQPQAPRRRR